MLQGRLTDSEGRGDEVVYADTHDKAYYTALTAQGRVRCPDCEAKLIHVSAVQDDDALREKFKAEAISVNGDASTRVPHWRSRSIEEHAAGCVYRDDPHDAQKTETFRAALKAGKTIRVNVNFDTGFEGLRGRFNAVSNPDSGLWEKKTWEQQFPDYVAVPARDITDILHYLQLAKAIGGQDGLKQLYFANIDSVQSCKRFVVRDRQNRMAEVLGDIFGRAVHSRARQQHYQETPRLFLFAVSERQMRIAQTEKTTRIFGQRFMIDEPAQHAVKLGMDLHDSPLTNQTVIDRGRVLWVAAAPSLSLWEINRIKAKTQAQDIENPGKPAFLMLNVRERRAMGVAGSENRQTLRAQERAANLPPRQLNLPLPQAAKRARNADAAKRKTAKPRSVPF